MWTDSQLRKKMMLPPLAMPLTQPYSEDTERAPFSIVARPSEGGRRAYGGCSGVAARLGDVDEAGESWHEGEAGEYWQVVGVLLSGLCGEQS